MGAMIAEAVFVGTELLLGEILNTNGQWLAQRLAELGIDHYHQVTVGDNWGRLEAALRTALGRADVVICSGGLGPTQDDITREVAAAVAGRPLQFDPAVWEQIEGWFRRTGRTPTENNKRQAMVPAGATVLPNPVGTAPGLIIPVAPGAGAAPAVGSAGPDGGGAAPGVPAAGPALVLLPGPPHEFQRVFLDHVVPYLTACMGGQPRRLYSRILRFCGIGESAVEAQVADLMAAQTDPTLAPYAKLGEVHLRLATKAATPEEAAARLDPLEAEIRRRLGAYLYGTDDTPLEAAVGALLRARGWTVAVAESCTGGLLAQRFTSVPGSSDYFLRGWVTYSNAAKEEDLGVPAAVLAQHGAVSAACVEAMAAGARRRAGAHVALAISGIAGPGGGTPEKPVGLVYVGLAAPDGTWSRQHQFRGGRAEVRQLAAQAALAWLWRYLAGG